MPFPARRTHGCSAIGPTYIDIDVTAGAVFYIAGESAIASRRVPLGQLPVLSRLISLLRRIPAVKWAFTRLRPLPHGGSIDVAPIAASDSPAIVVDIAEAVPAPDSISTNSLPGDTEIAVAGPVAEDGAAISVIPENPSAAPTDISVADDSSLQAPTEVEAVVVEEVSVSSVEVESEAVDAHELVTNDPPAEPETSVAPVVVEETPVPVVEIESDPVGAPELVGSDPSAELPVNAEPVIVEEVRLSPVEAESQQADVSEPVIGSDPSPELSTEVELVVVEEALVSSIDIEIAPVDAPVLAVSDNTSPDVADVESAVVEDPCVPLADSDVSAREVSESSIDSVAIPVVAMEIEPVPANDPAPIAAIAAEVPSADTASVVTHVAPEPILESPAPVIPSAPKTRAKVVEPVDRATLIRQRWTETGIRMWNPRLHGAGEATLNIQGRVELLPPAPGETMPRYDKLEFRMLGGQIVCEGVVVEAPASAGQRSFTRLAEPRNPDRPREPLRERQAALA
ncbi:hypothetical protein ABIF68_008816 [Bradyrhizobium japonicum]|uniref:hypothetical protein n=1 Tax=Bradyrhizobium japonicum TaxID=375 RepID=UPI0028159E9A|nr:MULTISPECIES: hypothetical protein [Bradyrhizobium]MCP1743562.1 hypothetical protein [Bradyrhizobium japonicum]MCP1861275.1 hypothetical protein [Bradyrhizobium japonicum]MCP1892036.1 hypothetical protein [Bradyrhizobium japonicum]MCW2325157.1 hypothetical protein [Bradyrhizobium japonicum]